MSIQPIHVGALKECFWIPTPIYVIFVQLDVPPVRHKLNVMAAFMDIT